MKNRKNFGRWAWGIIPLFVLFGALIILPESAVGQIIEAIPLTDTDGDGVLDNTDNCIYNANARQEDTDGDGIGDKCAANTFNASIETAMPAIMVPPGPHYVVSTPEYRAAFAVEVVKPCFAFAEALPTLPENSDLLLLDSKTGDFIGDYSNAVAYCLGLVNFGGTDFNCEIQTVPAQQVTWQTLMLGQYMCTAPGMLPIDIRVHAAAGANSIGVGVEILSDVAGPVRVTWKDARGALLGLTLPYETSLDQSWLVDGKGKMSIISAGERIYRISSVGCGAFGKKSAIEDDCPIPSALDANPAVCDNIFFKRLTEEVGDPMNSTVGPSEFIGINEHNGTTRANIRYYQEFFGNQSDSTVGTHIGDSNMMIECPADFFARNNAVSNRTSMGLRISKVSGPSVPSADPVSLYGRHAVAFDEEFVMNENNVSFVFYNDVDDPATESLENRFNGKATVYSQLPNGGGSCRFVDCASIHTGLAFAGSKVNVGDMAINGVGLAVGPGERVSGNDPCLISDPEHCIAGLARRGSFSANNATLTGGHGGLVCAESDCSVNMLTVQLGNDPNAVDQNFQLARLALGLSSTKGAGISWNPLTNEHISNVLLEGSCLVGDGSCNPMPMPGIDLVTTSGIANLNVAYANLQAQPEPFLPAGVGIACAQREGECNVGSLDPAYPRSLISGFETGFTTSGPANVTLEGVPLRHDSADRVLPSTANLVKADIRDVEVGVMAGSNVITTLNNVQVYNAQYNALVAGQDAANIATPENSGCDSDNGVDCLNRARQYATPNIGNGGEDNRVAIASGISAPTIIRVYDSAFGCTSCAVGADNLFTMVDGVPSCTAGNTTGLEPVISAADLDLETLEIICIGGTFPELKIAGAPACALSVPLAFVFGADMMLHSYDLIDGDFRNIVECTASPGVFIDNKDSKGVVPNISFKDSAFLKPDGTYKTDGIIAGTKADTALLLYEAKVESEIVTGKVPEPEDCQICVDSINWEKPGAVIAASNQCTQFVNFDNEAKDKRSACKAKCNALYSIAGYLADGEKQCLIDFCTAMNQQIDAGTRCVP